MSTLPRHHHHYINPEDASSFKGSLAEERARLIVRFYVSFNMFIGALLGGFTIIAMYWNTYNTGHLPININTMFTHNATAYNVSAILDENDLDEAKYQAYRPVYIAASSITYYIFFFAVYSAVISYAGFYHWNDIKLGFRSMWNSFRKNGAHDDFKDVHRKLMEYCREVLEWWYLVLNVVAVGLGVTSVAA